MRSYQLSVICITIAFVAVAHAQYHPSQYRGQQGGFIPSVQQESEEDDSRQVDATPAAAVNYRQQQPYEYEEDEPDQATQAPAANGRRQPYIRPNTYTTPNQNQKASNKKKFEEELEDEIEEPDRLSLLLEKSTFQCEGRTGYYADEGLNCEVFHYCQENQKHSWICPEGFSFHQVHLICMPPSGDNICQQSSKYHIVNDFLYKPINVEEHQTKPNVTLRYSERYYPEDIYHDERQEEEEYSHERTRHPIQVGLRKSTPTVPSYRQSTLQPTQANAYRSPDDINIPLQQRRPQIIFSPTTQRYEDEEYNNYEK